MEFENVSNQSIAALAAGAALAFTIPVIVAIIWKIKKKEPVSTILIGAATFIVFALILEKPIQNLLIVPDHAVSRFLNARPVLWAFVVGLFPGVFEETGRLVAFKTALKRRKNRETSISHGIGHGGAEVMLLLGYTYITYIAYAVMINTGAFAAVVEQVRAAAPAQAESLFTLADQLAAFSFADLGTGLLERVFACLFHTGASILVFYACRDKGKFFLYPLAVALHTALDFTAGLYLAKVLNVSPWAFEAIFAPFCILTFLGAFFLLYKKDRYTPVTDYKGERPMNGNTDRLLYQGHASLRITTASGKVIYIDPYAGEGYEPAADLILITHAHSDHTGVGLIKNRNPDCRVITYKEALEGGIHRVFNLDYVGVEAVEAGYNRNHSVTECVGYILTLPGGATVYVSGDTSKTKQMSLLAQRNIDYAFFCCDGIYNMDLDEASECASIVGAKHCIPYHMAPGRLFDISRAEGFGAANRLILTPGEEIELTV